MSKEDIHYPSRSVSPEEYNRTMATVCGAIAVVSFFGNLLMCIVIVRRRSMLAKPYNVLILSLALTDMLTGIFIASTPNYVLDRAHFPVRDNVAGDLFCRLIGSTYFLFLFGKASTLTVMCLTIERWFSVAKPLKYKYAFKRRRLLLYIGIIWAFSCCTQINELFNMKASQGTCERSDPPYDKNISRTLTVFHIVATFFLPSMVTWITFAHVWLHVRNNNLQRSCCTNYDRAKKRLIRMCALTALLLTVCWLPAEMFFVFKEFKVLSLPYGFYQFTDVLAMSNSCLNPWVYCLFNQEYRRALLSLVTVREKRRGNRLKNVNREPL